MGKYRVREVNGKFIPQVRIWNVIFPSWEGIDGRDFDTWVSLDYQYKYCAKSTLEEAKQVIENYKPKYHKV